MRNPPNEGPRLCEQQAVGGGQGRAHCEARSHSLVWVSWCLSSFERWLKAFPHAAQS